MAQHRNFEYGYLELTKLTGMEYANVRQHISRGNFDPDDLRTTVLWLAKHAIPAFRREINDAVLRIDNQMAYRSLAGAKKKVPTKRPPKKGD